MRLQRERLPLQPSVEAAENRISSNRTQGGDHTADLLRQLSSDHCKAEPANIQVKGSTLPPHGGREPPKSHPQREAEFRALDYPVAEDREETEQQP